MNIVVIAMKTNLNALKNSSCKLLIGVEAQPPNGKLKKNLEVFFSHINE